MPTVRGVHKENLAWILPMRGTISSRRDCPVDASLDTLDPRGEPLHVE